MGSEMCIRDSANAAAVLVIADKVPDLKNGVSMAADAIDTGKARNILETYIQMTRPQ